jgi:hypothetical protein
MQALRKILGRFTMESQFSVTRAQEAVRSNLAGARDGAFILTSDSFGPRTPQYGVRTTNLCVIIPEQMFVYL